MRASVLAFAVVSCSLASLASCSDDTAAPSTPADAGVPETEAPPSDAAVDSAASTGTVIATASPSAAGIWSTSIATDGTYVYWLEGGAVKRVPVGGGSIEDVATGQVEPTGIIAGAAGVLWANKGNGQIMRLAPGASGPTIVATSSAWPNALGVDASFAYWVEQKPGAFTEVRPGAVARAPLGGGAVEILTTVPDPGLLGSLAVLGDEIYFTDLGKHPSFVGPVARTKAAPDAGAPEIVAPDQKEPTGIASNGSIVAWANQGSIPSSFTDGSIVTYAKGGTPTTIAANRSNPGFIAVDATHVYWQERVDSAVNRIMKAKTSGGDPIAVARVESSSAGPPSGFAIDGSNVYWGAGGSIRRAPK